MDQNKVKEYVYVVTCDDPWLDYNYVVAVFKGKEAANTYADTRREEDPECYYKVEAIPLV